MRRVMIPDANRNRGPVPMQDSFTLAGAVLATRKHGSGGFPPITTQVPGKREGPMGADE